MTEELYKKYRPSNFKQMVGQDDVVAMLTKLGKSNSIPHTILFSGPSGCGKTTLARILRKKLKCSDYDFYEMNAAEKRGIDMIRDIQSRMKLSPIGGSCRIWLIDECHQLTSQAQESFLKILEDTPSHVYFFLASTNPSQLKKTIITRSTEIKVQELKDEEIIKLVTQIAEEEEKKIPKQVAVKIAEISEGSARKSLVHLHEIIGLGNEDPEQIRWLILSYMSKVAMNRPERACTIIEEFRDNFFDSKKAGLISSCFQIIKG